MTDKIQQARRAAFDNWYASRYGEVDRHDTLAMAAMYDALEVFNAALDCVVVELPTPAKAMAVVIDYQDNKRQNVTGTTNWAANLGMCVVNECRTAIESTNLGIKVK